MIRSAKDFWTGIIYIFFGSSAIFLAREYGMGTAVKMGPAYFPSVLGGLLILIGLISFIRSFTTTGTPIEKFALKGLAFIMVSTVLFGLLVRRTGLILALPLLVLVSAYASKEFNWVSSSLMAIGLTLFCILVFLKGLGIPLPIIGPWFVG
jgi:hypothetical protein